MALTKTKINLGTEGNLSGSRSLLGIENTLVSSSAQLATSISGSFTAASSSFSTRVAQNETSASSLTSDSGSFSTRVTRNEATGSSLTTASSSFSSRTSTLEGSGTAQGTGTTNSPTFADGTYTSNLGVSGSLTVKGMVTAEEFHTQFVSASIVYQSGSTKFGDTIDDIHSFTGSINQSGSFNLNDGNMTITDTLTATTLTGTTIKDFSTISGSSTSTGSFGSVHTAGNVGIGNTAPSQPLTVEGNISGSGNLDIDGNMTASGDAYFGSNVGIGTTSPDAKLEVQTDIDAVSGSKFSISSGNDSYTKLLIHSDDTDGNTTFIDSSANSHVITVYADTHHESTTKAFGASSIEFDGTGDYLAAAASSNGDWQLGNTFTIDCWVNFNATNQDQLIFHHRYDASYDFQFYKKTSNAWAIAHDSVDQLTWNWSPSSGTWYHIALVNNAGTLSVYVDGTALSLTSGTNGSYTAPSVPVTTTVRIGRRMHGDMYMNGYIDEYRVSKGIARWTSNFTPPTRPYSHALTVDGPKGKLYTVTDSMETHGSGSIFSVNTSGGLPVIEAKDDYTTHLRGNLSLREPFTTPTTTGNETKIYTKKDTKPDSFTTLLLHSDTTDGSTDFVDSSFGHNIVRTEPTPNPVRGTYHSTAQSKFGNSSIFFNGSTHGTLVALDSSDWDWGTGPYTVDMWVYSTGSFSNTAGFMDMNTTGDEWSFAHDSSGYIVYNQGGGGSARKITGTTVMPINSWNHIAIVRESGGSTKLYLNGSQEGSTYTDSVDHDYDKLWLGSHNEANYNFTGYMDEVRVSKGIARWTAAFTPQTTPYETDANTVLLIHSDTSHGDTYFLDSSETTSTRKTITAAGNLRHETDYSKFGATSIFIPDAQTDTAEIPLHSDFEFTGDFTIDMWVNVSSGGDRSLYVQHDGSTYFALNYSKSATQFNLYINSGGASQTPAYDLVGWNHVAWIRSGDQLVLYVNGTAINTVTNSSTLGYAAGSQTLNRLGGGAATTPHYCDEVRISKGIARWTSNFDPPKRPYPLNEDKLLIKSDDGVEKTVIAAEPYGVAIHGQVLKATGEDGVQWQNNSVELFYQAQSMYAVSSDLRNLQSVGNWIMAANMEVGNNFVVGKAPAGFVRVTAIKIGVFNVQGQFANQGVRMKWEIASDGQGYQTHTQGITTVRTFPGTDTAANTIFEADAFNLTGTNDFEDIISPGDYFGMAFDDLQNHNSSVLGVGITWEF